ncbi:MAG: hypothetical protein KME42_18805 [Tildeniella nuda ZEHNDER 1965/U140]|jgi:ribonuclease-3|nr:hypothetical protein [Tildeniella nuda ZEHNDER 1965/U140]
MNVNDQELRQWVQQHFGIRPQDLNKYRRALTIRQYEVLEFFGDAVLAFVVSEYLVSKYLIDRPEWFTNVRAEIVKNDNLTQIGQKIDIVSVANIPQSQITDRVIADLVEALIGAIYQDCGLKKCETAIRQAFDLATVDSEARQRVEAKVRKDIAELERKQPVSALQEFLADKGELKPDYSELNRVGTPNLPIFTFEATCKFERKTYTAEGQGGSKAKAKQNAAQNLFAEMLKVYKKSWGID